MVKVPGSVFPWEKDNEEQQELVCMTGYKEQLQKNRVKLTRNLRLSDIWAHLRELAVVDRINEQDLKFNAPEYQVVERLLDFIEAGPAWGFHALMRACALTGQDCLIEVLDLDPQMYYTENYTTAIIPNTKGGTKKRSLRWFQETQLPLLKQAPGQFAEWFHGIITRKEAERLLQHKPTGCFLIRVSESRFGYSLSFKTEDRCRHYMIDKGPSGKYFVIGERWAHKSLNDMVVYYRKTALSNWTRMLGEPCGQEDGQCDYWDLLDAEDRLCIDINNDKRGQSLLPPRPPLGAGNPPPPPPPPPEEVFPSALPPHPLAPQAPYPAWV